MPSVKVKKTSKQPKKILDGADINQDLHYLVGYVWSLGNTKGVFPSTELSDLIEYFLDKHDLR